MTDTVGKLATYQDLLKLPEEARAEIIGGEVVVGPSPTPAHQSIIGSGSSIP